MKLLTQEIRRNLPALYSQEDNDDPTVVFKLFNPAGIGTWYIIEGNPVAYTNEGTVHLPWDVTDMPPGEPIINADDVLLFGLCDLGFPELGYVSLNELMEVQLPFGLTIERDKFFEPKPLSEVS